MLPYRAVKSIKERDIILLIKYFGFYVAKNFIGWWSKTGNDAAIVLDWNCIREYVINSVWVRTFFILLSAGNSVLLKSFDAKRNRVFQRSGGVGVLAFAAIATASNGLRVGKSVIYAHSLAYTSLHAKMQIAAICVEKLYEIFLAQRNCTSFRTWTQQFMH